MCVHTHVLLIITLKTSIPALVCSPSPASARHSGSQTAPGEAEQTGTPWFHCYWFRSLTTRALESKKHGLPSPERRLPFQSIPLLCGEDPAGGCYGTLFPCYCFQQPTVLVEKEILGCRIRFSATESYAPSPVHLMRGRWLIFYCCHLFL